MEEKYNMKKILYYSVIGLIGVFGAGMLVRKIRKDIEKAREGSEQKETVTEHVKEINKEYLSYPDSTYKSYASRLYEEMDSAFTSDDAVLQIILKMKTKDDWHKLVAEFGIKSKTGFSNFKGNLITWLQDQLYSPYLKAVGKYLSKLGVNDF